MGPSRRKRRFRSPAAALTGREPHGYARRRPAGGGGDLNDLELVLRAINLFCAALVVGGVTFAHMNVVPIIRRWDDELALKLHREMVDVNPDRYIRPCAIISQLAALGALVAADGLPDSSLVLTIEGMVLLLGTAAVSESVNQPINRRTHREAPERLVASYRSLVRRWDDYNLIRTLFALAGLFCYVLGALEAT